MAMHADELEITDDLVRSLVERDVPTLSDRPVRRLAASGSSTVLYRLGSEHLVRLPLQPGGSAAIEQEARWLPWVAPALPVAVPEVVAVGAPGFGYPERWTVTTWIEGDQPATPKPDGPGAEALAGDLAALMAALHAVDVPADAVTDPGLRWYRTGPPAAVDADVRRYLQECRRLPDLGLDLDACAQIWTEAVRLPSARGADCWVHADLVAENLLVRDGRLAAVLDFGGLAVGDPSVDLMVAWEVLGPEARQVLRSAVDVDDVTWARGRAWALAVAVMTLPYYWTSMPARCAARLGMARQVVADYARS